MDLICSAVNEAHIYEGIHEHKMYENFFYNFDV